MIVELAEARVAHQQRIDLFLKNYFVALKNESRGFSPLLIEAMEYAVLNGGKRFRPLLSYLTAEAFGISPDKVTPFAAAVEMVHAFSLVHDDLPCMDNDDLRRGQPTTHKKFGEALALLAGDALQTEAFYLLTQHYAGEMKALSLIEVLTRATGLRGMTGGQAMDMGFGEKIQSIEQLKKVHQGKTGALIAAAVEGVGSLARLTSQQQGQARQFGELVGLVFQIKDDLLDYEQDPSEKNYPQMIGAPQTENILQSLSQEAVTILKDLTTQWQSLEALLIFNLERKT